MRILYLFHETNETVLATTREIIYQYPHARVFIASKTDSITVKKYEACRDDAAFKESVFYALLEDMDFDEFVPGLGNNQRLLKLIAAYDLVYVDGLALTGAIVDADFKVNEVNDKPSILRVYSVESKEEDNAELRNAKL